MLQDSSRGCKMLPGAVVSSQSQTGDTSTPKLRVYWQDSVLPWLLDGGPRFLPGFLDRVWLQFCAVWGWQLNHRAGQRLPTCGVSLQG